MGSPHSNYNERMVSFCHIDVGQVDSDLYFRIRGYASYSDAAQISQFMKERHADATYPHVVFNLLECVKMDSTFMGLMASLACAGEDAGKVCVLGCSPEAFKCLDDLGLTQIITVKESGVCPGASFHSLTASDVSVETEDVIRRGHESLSRINETNRKKFEGVIRALELEHARKSGSST